MLDNKTVLVGITGGIAAYKIASLVSMLKKRNVDVHVIMTENATEFITPTTFEAISGNRTVIDTFDRNFPFEIEHVALAKKADLFLVAPATANTMAKLAYGIADNMLTTTFLAANCPKIVAPAMNTNMYLNPATQSNMDQLEALGVTVIPADDGYLACGDKGFGKMPEPEMLLSYIEKEIGREHDMVGMNVLVTAGATREDLDPVRFITNHSTGKMGIAIAKECMMRGANVVLCKAGTTIEPPNFIQVVDTPSAKEMFFACEKYAKGADLIFKAAAVADYRPMHVSENKIKKNQTGEAGFSVELTRTEDILKYLGEHKTNKQVICGFSMETENLIDNSTKKLHAKKADIIVANNLKHEGAGFGTDTNMVTIITEGDCKQLKLLTKEEVAEKVVDKALDMKKIQP